MNKCRLLWSFFSRIHLPPNLPVHACLTLSQFKIPLTNGFFQNLNCWDARLIIFSQEGRSTETETVLAWEGECGRARTDDCLRPSCLLMRARHVLYLFDLSEFGGGTSVAAMYLCVIQYVLWMAPFSVWLAETDPVPCCFLTYNDFLNIYPLFSSTHTWSSLTFSSSLSLGCSYEQGS